MPIRGLLALAIPIALFDPSSCAVAQSNSGPPPAQWQRAIGTSGLRKFYSTGSDLGELVNRSVSYRIAESIAARTGLASPQTDVDNYVLHFDTLIPLDTAREQPLRLRALVRAAQRDQSRTMDSRNDRLDLGFLYAPNAHTYLGAGLAAEWTTANLSFARAQSTTHALGLRFDAGVVLETRWALGLRVEQLHLQGSQTTVRPTSPLDRVDRPLDSDRRFLKMEAIKQLNVDAIGLNADRMQILWRTGLYHVSTSYAPQLDSKGSPVVEPFGPTEHLTTVRSGLQLSRTFSARWQGTAELLWDYEARTNMNTASNDPHTLMIRTGAARSLGRGKRISFEHHRAQALQHERVRDLLIVLAVVDF